MAEKQDNLEKLSSVNEEVTKLYEAGDRIIADITSSDVPVVQRIEQGVS
jgi:hypothetical protein